MQMQVAPESVRYRVASQLVQVVEVVTQVKQMVAQLGQFWDPLS